ncbi:LuxR family transcriptional regulator [Mycolicibacterium sp. HK-90]|uniref:helix-turn-helix transcriptional regulator n=1 Tax=Mycolicibacterium sp. HK-90 TaxID=3056937 RepID=UPI00265AA7B5|nr:LuxR family transcriptional regulator [Mycolicibacterium sp. HK-90]WKG02168.1 LuxR C-terminal-related transcriptional regulator [Mycolicibacterium sp. HK-90]
MSAEPAGWPAWTAETPRVEDMERVDGARGRLLGRHRECATLDEIIAGAAGGHSAALVLRGEAGIGKTALLDYVSIHATGCRVVRVAGIEAEAELAFGGLHRLCAPLRKHFDRLPVPQRSALETAFGLSAGTPPDRFLVGLAVLSLLADVASQQPVVCLIDDAQWLDQISAQTLSFVGRRLLAERVVLLFAVREPADGDALKDLSALQIEGLGDHDARTLLAWGCPGCIENRVLDRILAESRGNPLALLELPRTLSAAQLAMGTGRLDDQPLSGQLEKGFLRRLRSLSSEAQHLVLLAAADPVGDVALLRRAAVELDIDIVTADAEAQAADLLTVGAMVRFRHPLVRSAAYRSATTSQRRQVHRALAEATDPEHDPDRRTWHLASAAARPDEDVAAGLELAAARARARGGAAAAAAFLGRAAELTPDPGRRGSRSLAAAQAKSEAGEFGDALDLLDGIRTLSLTKRERALAELVRGRSLFSFRSASAGLPALLSAAEQLQVLDPALATETYRDAFYAALTAGRLSDGVGLEQVAAAVLAMRRPTDPACSDLLLEGVSRMTVVGYAAGAPLVHRALAAYRTGGLSPEEGLGWLPLACRLAHNTWEFDSWSALSARLVELAVDAGALAVLPSALLLRLSNRVYAGDLAASDALVAQATTLGEVTGSSFFAHYGALVVEPWRGDETRTRRAIDLITADPLLRGEGKTLTATEWAAAVLYNGLGRYDEALAAARRGSAYPRELGLSTWSMVELVEAAARSGVPADAAEAVRRIEDMAAVSETDWARGTAAYVGALVADSAVAEQLYRTAIELLERTDVRMLTARAYLVYGEWLRREQHRGEARQLLGRAYTLLNDMGAAGFAERARRELAAAGVAPSNGATAGRRVPDAVSLTTQEMQIARLAADGLTNSEIGAQLFISAHTVEWHLRKVFSKFGIRSRRDIAAKLES